MSEEIYLSQLGKKIRQKRQEKKLSLDKLALLCDVEKANLSRIESGKTNFTVLTLRKITMALFTHPSEMFLD
jgi:transcriptional regulator with XRE-family HTH domain